MQPDFLIFPSSEDTEPIISDKDNSSQNNPVFPLGI